MIFFEVRHQGELVELDPKGPCSGLWLVLKPRFRTEAHSPQFTHFSGFQSQCCAPSPLIPEPSQLPKRKPRPHQPSLSVPISHHSPSPSCLCELARPGHFTETGSHTVWPSVFCVWLLSRSGVLEGPPRRGACQSLAPFERLTGIL